MDGVTYLITQYAEREQVKSLGARWDPSRRSWYVPAGRDLEPFARWLPAGATATGTALQAPAAAGSDLLAPARRGTTLSQLLAGVARAVAQAYAEGVWTMVEVVDARLRNGHVYLEVSERGAAGEIAAKASAIVWANTAARILPAFEQATGAKIGPGIKLLLRLRPVFKPQWGFSLEVDAIDPDYTLGDLEAKKREIRARLQREGLFDANRRLPPPWDFTAVLVVAPDGAAGLGDFRAEADRLERAGICRFVYASSRFQGEGAAAEVRRALLGALDAAAAGGGALPDAVAIIRGGGAVNDLAWLNDYKLARAVCEAPVPVLTGIGHERDRTILDEVAHQAFDTPSKAILGIEQAIHRRVRQAEGFFRELTALAAQTLQAVRTRADGADATVRDAARRQIATATRQADAHAAALRAGALQRVRDAGERAGLADRIVRQAARQQVSAARSRLPRLIGDVQAEARAGLRATRAAADAAWAGLLAKAAADTARVDDEAKRTIAGVGADARRALRDAAVRSEALVREIAGQGPEKTLARGFAIVRAADGATVTSAREAGDGRPLQIQFRDGVVDVAAPPPGDPE